MTRYEWLDSKDNRDEVYALLRFTLEDVQPDEVPFLDGLYGNYVELARQGDVVLDDQRRPFNVAGAEDVITVWLIPLVIEVANSLIIAAGLYSLKKSADLLRHRVTAPSSPDAVRDCIRPILDDPSFRLDQEDRESLEHALVQAVEMLLSV
jgi:hypothetical protein